MKPPTHRESPHALTSGSWELRGSVLVWQPDDPAAFLRWRTGDPCGSNAGYQRHRAAREDACDDCSAAHRKTGADYRAKERRTFA